MTGPVPNCGSRRSTADAISSSPQLAGSTFEKPARRQACASCTGLAGWAAGGYAIETKTHSAPRISYRDLPDEHSVRSKNDDGNGVRHSLLVEGWSFHRESHERAR